MMRIKIKLIRIQEFIKKFLKYMKRLHLSTKSDMLLCNELMWSWIIFKEERKMGILNWVLALTFIVLGVALIWYGGNQQTDLHKFKRIGSYIIILIGIFLMILGLALYVELRANMMWFQKSDFYRSFLYVKFMLKVLQNISNYSKIIGVIFGYRRCLTWELRMKKEK